jgi:chromosome segregation ATPase
VNMNDNERSLLAENERLTARVTDLQHMLVQDTVPMQFLSTDAELRDENKRLIARLAELEAERVDLQDLAALRMVTVVRYRAQLKQADLNLAARESYVTDLAEGLESATARLEQAEEALERAANVLRPVVERDQANGPGAWDKTTVHHDALGILTAALSTGEPPKEDR